jgi:hypothetical protein
MKKPLVVSNYPTSSYNLVFDGSVMAEPKTSVPGRRGDVPGALPSDSPRYDWQITWDKISAGKESPRPRMKNDGTHPIPRFGASERRGNSPMAESPVVNFNLADEYRTNLARGFKFTGGIRSSSPSLSSTLDRTQSPGINGNSRIRSLHRGGTIKLPETSLTDYATKDLTDVSSLVTLQVMMMMMMFIGTETLVTQLVSHSTAFASTSRFAIVLHAK